MKDIKNYDASKYQNYKKETEEIYITQSKNTKELIYVTSLSFIQEPSLNEGDCAQNISQYPLEDILTKYLVHITDFYPELNTKDSKVCYLEFASPSLNDILNLREIINKHVYNKKIANKIELIIE